MKEAAPILKHCATWLLSAASQRNIDAQTWSVAGLALSTIVSKFPVLHIDGNCFLILQCAARSSCQSVVNVALAFHSNLACCELLKIQFCMPVAAKPPP